MLRYLHDLTSQGEGATPQNSGAGRPFEKEWGKEQSISRYVFSHRRGLPVETVVFEFLPTRMRLRSPTETSTASKIQSAG